jgi:predicted HAD superfamily hydrolase
MNIHNMINDMATTDMAGLYAKVRKYRIISFDVFDTLLRRDTPDPAGVFDLVGWKCGIPDFREMRQKAEQEARSKNPDKDVTLDDIYASLEVPQSLRDRLHRCEIDCEISVSTLNRDMIRFYRYCLEHATVILVTDMYLPGDVIRALLQKNQITGYQKLFVSNEYNATKYEGGLYDVVCREMNADPSEILHIGNAFRADFLVPGRKHIRAEKIATHACRTMKKYKDEVCTESGAGKTRQMPDASEGSDGAPVTGTADLRPDYGTEFSSTEKKRFLNAFLNNHTDGRNPYDAFGYEQFGPLLFGFVRWLMKKASEDGTEQLFFVARDGFIIRRAWKIVAGPCDIPDFYFEGSRRSFRVPSYTPEMSMQEIIDSISLPIQTTVAQIFDGLGLDTDRYRRQIESHGFSPEMRLNRDELCADTAFCALFREVSDDIFANAAEEKKALEDYLAQFDFGKKTALVDIGWGGTMQKYLTKLLTSTGRDCRVNGYYIGLNERSGKILGEGHMKAEAYVFDMLNHPDDRFLIRPFYGLFETLFFEQAGSVKRYRRDGERTVAERYPYELDATKELQHQAEKIRRIQEGALRFCRDFQNCIYSDLAADDAMVMFSNLYQTGTDPTLSDAALFGDFKYFNGVTVSLAAPDSAAHYLRDPKKLRYDFYDSAWKTGFMKRLLKAGLPYRRIYDELLKLSPTASK